MTKEQARERIIYLREQIAYNSRLYYENDAPAISDYEYDMMFKELGELEAQYPELDSPTSPTKRVGGKALDRFEKFTHSVRMGSLTDVFSYEELCDFIDRTNAILGADTEYTVEPKIDGLSVSLIYRDGKFVCFEGIAAQYNEIGQHAAFDPALDGFLEAGVSAGAGVAV